VPSSHKKVARSFFLKFFILAVMLLGFPLLGITLAGLPLCQYLEFPPETRYVSHAPFSWVAFVIHGLFILSVITPLFIRAVRAGRKVRDRLSPSYPFPWWGWLGIVTGLIAWIMAWTRFSWFSEFQPHTFTPLWVSFILVINGLTYRRKGRCMIVDQPKFFLLLFPTSAAFWWFFEYLNRFVQNWFYVGVHFSSWEYFCYATLSFSMVLPAVLGTREWILSFSWLEQGFANFLPLRFSQPKVIARAVLLVASAGLAGIGVWPNYLFVLLWVSPLLIIVSLQSLMEERYILGDIGRGDWRLFISSAMAALFCGWFWEMWNFYSLAKWEYTVPFVHRYQIFEMPVLGYAGYLPFGLECAVIGGMLEWQGASGPKK
jgi:hypothetical protein